MADVKLGRKTYMGVQSVKMDTVDGGEALFPNYVIGEPYEVTIGAASWSNHYYSIYLQNYTYDEHGVQLGLPAAGSSANAERCIEAGLTIASSRTAYNEKNAYWYTYVYVSAVEVPTEDITIALFGLRATA